MMAALLVAVMTLLFSFQSLFCKLFSAKYKSGDAAMTSTVFSIAYGAFTGVATLVLSVLYSRFLFKERITPVKLLAVAMAVVSIVMLSV